MKSGTVSIIGRPNSGKSTLLNALVGQKISIVSDKPQTTRHRILGVVTEPRGQIVLVDTPGIHKPGYRMNERMMRSALNSLRDADLALHLVDGSISFGAGERFILDLLKQAQCKAVLCINKIDSFAKPLLLPIMDRYSKEYSFSDIVPVSALTGENLNVLLNSIFKQMPEGDACFDAAYLTDRSERFLTGELIRERVLQRAREELPYTTAVLVWNFDDGARQTRNLVRVQADILVEKKSQQGIILGRAGTGLRDLGTEARRDIEKLLGCKVFLGLRVKTVNKWRDNESVLDELEVGG